MQHREIVIIGGGPIGYTTAIHLAAKGIKVTILNDDMKAKSSSDGRVLALSYASYAYLNDLGIWAKDSLLATKIDKVHISHDGFGRSMITASDVQLPCLGFTIKYPDLMFMLKKMVEQMPGITQYKCRVTEVIPMRGYAVIKYNTSHMSAVDKDTDNSIDTNDRNNLDIKTLTARLVIVAEGGNLAVRGVEYTEFNYKQMAIVATLQTQNLANAIAYERFGNNGAFVMLPYKSQFVLVWSVDVSVTKNEIDADMKLGMKLGTQPLSTEVLLSKLMENKFFRRFGKCTILGDVHVFPLYKRIARTKALDSVLIVGNSAQTLHPVSAQGLNLGLRDVRILCENIDTLTSDKCFNQLRESDTQYIANFTHNLARFVEIDASIIKHLRGIGIIALSNCKPLQNKISTDLIFGI